jgi:hypothetical protein
LIKLVYAVNHAVNEKLVAHLRVILIFKYLRLDSSIQQV